MTFRRPISIAAERLSIQPFRETQRVRSFRCGNSDLDDFLNTEEVETYERDGLGRTYLVYLDGNLVAYFSVSAEGLRIE